MRWIGGSISFLVLCFLLSNATDGATDDLKKLLWNAYDISANMSLVCAAVAAYSLCPHSKFREKFLSIFFVIIAVLRVFWNASIQFELIPDKYILYAYFSSVALVGLLYSKMAVTYDSLPEDEIREGYIYTIISKPRSHLQWLGFWVTLGKGGSFAWTNGKTIKKYSKSKGELIEFTFDKTFLIGKKVIETGPETPQTSKPGTKFTVFFRNCITGKW